MVKVDRVEWITMADPQTALNALAAGDIDFVERLPWDMLSILEKDPSLVVRTLDEAGFQTLGRMNFLHPPFNNVKVRRPALLRCDRRTYSTRWLVIPHIIEFAERSTVAIHHTPPTSARKRW